MKKCPKCSTVFDSKFCPNCGTPAEECSDVETVAPAPPPAPVKQKGKNKGCLIAIVVAVVLVVALAGIFGSKGKSASSSSAAANAAPAKSQAAAASSSAAKTSASSAAKSEYGINDPATYKNANITVLKVERSQGGTYDKPKSGNEFIIVTVQYKNVGKDRISYNPFDFELQNSQGQIVNMGFTTVNSDTALSSGDLAPGGTVSGTIAFETPAGDTGLKLNYTGNILSNNEKIVFALK